MPPARLPFTPVTDTEGIRLVEALQRGDETAFTTLVERYQGFLLQLASAYVPSREVAEEVVQEAWLGIYRGVQRFEGRSSLRTWMARIVVNQAKTIGMRERRSIAFSDLGGEDDGPSVDPGAFLDETSRWAGHWSTAQTSWEGVPEERLLSGEVRELIGSVIATLPEQQRAVITMRDVEGLSSEETRGILDIGEANQRVLLHRARCRVRASLQRYLDAG
jgi:RNA polymerase sigma-70 factor (ECF subfamily)